MGVRVRPPPGEWLSLHRPAQQSSTNQSSQPHADQMRFESSNGVRDWSDVNHNDHKVLNGLERMGYRVVSSSCMITGYGRHDTRDFIWTMHKAKEEWEASSK